MLYDVCVLKYSLRSKGNRTAGLGHGGWRVGSGEGGPEAWRLRSSRKPEGDCVREVTGWHILAENPVLPRAVPMGDASAGYWQVAPPGRRRLCLLGGWRVCQPLWIPAQDGHSIACPG